MAARVVHIFETDDYDPEIAAAARVLQEGGVVVMPTETVYGAAGVLTNEASRARLRALKAGSPPAIAGGAPSPLPPLTIHLAHRDEAMAYLGEVSEIGKRLMKKVWPGPVGLIFDVPPARRVEVAARLDLPESELYSDGTITLRCPDHPVAADVIATISRGADGNSPVVFTQAETASGDTAYKATSLAPRLLEAADIVLDAGPTRFTKPSTLLKVGAPGTAVGVGGVGGGYEVVRNGVYDRRIIDRMLTSTILFVCSGNTCRSPMAMALARKILGEKLGVPAPYLPEALEAKGVSVISAGSFAMAGARATPQGVEAVSGMGADLSAHRSRPLTVELIHSADVIYTMSRSHRAAVLALVPSAAEKTFLLDPKGEIEDPIGASVSVYKSLAVEMEKLIQARLEERPLV